MAHAVHYGGFNGVVKRYLPAGVLTAGVLISIIGFPAGEPSIRAFGYTMIVVGAVLIAGRRLELDRAEREEAEAEVEYLRAQLDAKQTARAVQISEQVAAMSSARPAARHRGSNRRHLSAVKVLVMGPLAGASELLRGYGTQTAVASVTAAAAIAAAPLTLPDAPGEAEARTRPSASAVVTVTQKPAPSPVSAEVDDDVSSSAVEDDRVREVEREIAPASVARAAPSEASAEPKLEPAPETETEFELADQAADDPEPEPEQTEPPRPTLEAEVVTVVDDAVDAVYELVTDLTDLLLDQQILGLPQLLRT